MKNIPMSKEILDVINAVITYGRFIRSHNYIVPKEDFNHIAEMEKYYHSIPLPPGMSKNRADFEKMLQIGWYSGVELERLNNTEQSDLHNIPWKPNKFFEVNLVNYDENNIPYNVGTTYFSASKLIDKEIVTAFCREDLDLAFEEVFSINEIPYDEVSEYVNDTDILLLDGYEYVENTTDYIPTATKGRNIHTTAVEICDLFEEVLEQHDIFLPNDEEGSPSGARLYGTTYDELVYGIRLCLHDFANYNKYSVAKEVKLENFKNAMECLGYSPRDYTEEELLSLLEAHLDKLDNNGTYSAIYNEALSEVLKEHEKTNNTAKSSQKRSFIDDLMDGKVAFSDIDRYVEYWHTHDTGDTLQEFLGLTDDEMEGWANSSDTSLDNIINKAKRLYEKANKDIISKIDVELEV